MNEVDIGDDYGNAINEEQNKDLSQILGGLELMAVALANLAGIDAKTFQDALNAAKNGDFTALQNILNNPNTPPELKNAIDAYLKTLQLLKDGEKPGPLDDKKLKDLADALKKLQQSPLTDSLQNTLDSVNKWNDMAKKLKDLAQNPGGQGQGGAAAVADFIATVQQALAAVGYGGGDGYGVAPDYGYAAGYGVAGGYSAQPAVPPAPIPGPPVPAAPVVTAPALLSNPAENNVTMPFLLNDETTELPAGQRLELPTDRAWEIKFDRGQGLGVAHYSLGSGSYKFTYTNQGWELVQGE